MKLKELLEEYPQEYCKQRSAEPEVEVKRWKLEDIEDEAIKEGEPGKLGELYREHMAEYAKQKVDKEPMHEAASSSMVRATYVEAEGQTREPGMDIDQIVTEAWARGNVTNR